MRVRAVFYTEESTPEVPRLDSAWDEHALRADAEVTHRQVADALGVHKTAAAGELIIELPDVAVLACMTKRGEAPPMTPPTLRCTVAD
jgi:hypothetical protein